MTKWCWVEFLWPYSACRSHEVGLMLVMCLVYKSSKTVCGISIMMAATKRVCDLESAAGFEGCSLVPSIYPLETLHNSLSLKQVDEFLTALCKNGSEAQFKRLKCKWTNTFTFFITLGHHEI